MLNSIILFLLQKKLKVKSYEKFKFNNQNSENDYYYFTEDGLIKYSETEDLFKLANVSLNWLLSKECAITIQHLKKDERKILEITYKLQKLSATVMAVNNSLNNSLKNFGKVKIL